MAYTKIAGKSQATVQQIRTYLKNKNPKIPAIILQQAVPLYLSQGQIEGIRGDIAVAQSVLETGFWTFKGSAVTLDQNNFCGMGVTKNGLKGNSFSSIQEGIRAQIQHLKAYANKQPLKEKCVDPRFKYVERGCIPFVDVLGIQENPKRQGWSAGAKYGPQILNILKDILNIKITTPSKSTTTSKTLNKTKKYIGTITADYLNIRSWAGINNPTVSFSPLKKKTNVDICDQLTAADGTKWYYICYGGKYGFASSKYIELTIEKTTKEEKTNYLAAVAKWAPVVYNKVVQLKCAHKTGAKSFNDIINKKITTCATSVSAVLQQAGCLEFGKKISHTAGVWGSTETILKKKNSIEKALTNSKYLIPNTYDIVKIGKVYSKMSSKYKKAGIVYIQDSNICINAGGDQIWSTNQGAAQYKNGHYFNALNKGGYPFTSIILYAIVPRS